MYVCMYVSRHHSQTLGPKRPKLGIGSLRVWVILLHTCGHANGCGFTIATPTGCYFCRKKVSQRPIRQKEACGLQVPGGKIIIHMCGSAIATPTGSCFGY